MCIFLSSYGKRSCHVLLSLLSLCHLHIIYSSQCKPSTEKGYRLCSSILIWIKICQKAENPSRDPGSVPKIHNNSLLQTIEKLAPPTRVVWSSRHLPHLLLGPSSLQVSVVSQLTPSCGSLDVTKGQTTARRQLSPSTSSRFCRQPRLYGDRFVLFSCVVLPFRTVTKL